MEDSSEPKLKKCYIGLVNMFHGAGPVSTACGHCLQGGQFSPHDLEVDMSSRVIFIQCSACDWTTVRRISICNRVV